MACFTPASECTRFQKYDVRRRTLKTITVAGSCTLVLAVAAFLGLATPARAQNEGANVFKAKCAMCHGADGKGDTSMGKALKIRDLSSSDVQKQTDAELTTIISDGKGKMPAYKGKVSDADIKHLVEFIRTLKKK
jgi:cytochrome c6